MRPLLRSCWFLLALLGCADLAQGADAIAWNQTRPAARYDRAFLPAPQSAARIHAAGNLGGATGECCIIGWVEYDFDVPRAGWYELAVAGSGSQIEYLINPGAGTKAWYTFDSSGNVSEGLDKVGNFWLEGGRNTVRLQRYYWSGFPRLSQVVLRAAPATPAGSMRAVLEGSTRVFRAGECAPLVLHAGGIGRAMTVIAEIRDAVGNALGTRAVQVPAGTTPRRQTLALPCEAEGDLLVSFREQTAGWLAWRDVRGISYQVVARAPAASKPSQRTLLREIDLSVTPPDFSGGDTRVVRSAAGAYRESGSVGFTRYQRAPDAVRRALPDPSWFAYALEALTPQTLHEVEIDYPDDAERSVVITLREPAPLSYPVSSGFDTGGEFTNSTQLRRHSLLFWPRTDKARVVMMNVHDGRRAAAARIRVYRRDDLDSPSPVEGGRQVLQWYEEGANFHSVVGTPEAPRYEFRAQPQRIGAERWVQLAKHGGATVVAPTVSVYSFGLYPSRFNRMFSTPEGEQLRHLLLAAEKHGLGVIPELHPRADELDWPHATGGHPRPNLLLSREGRTNFHQRDGRTRNVPPHFNPIDARNQDWYVGHIDELLRQHRDSPALMGVSLRLMSWANASLNNFVSLDWGYDDLTFSAFVADTRSPAPVALLAKVAAHPDLAGARHAWLMRHAREAWITWRCARITTLYTRIRDTVRAVRPDLKLYTTVFTWQEDKADAQSLREAGIDLDALSALDGVEIIDARGTYGRREPDDASNRIRRQRLLTPQPLRASTTTASTTLLSTASYVEATDIIAPPERIGLPPDTRRTWSSTAMTPAGHHILERYATQLARADVTLLGDGGNGYAIGQPLLHEWLREFRALPARPFETLVQDNPAITLRWRDQGRRFVAYVVNRSGVSLDVALSLSGTDQVRRLVGGQVLALANGRLSLRIGPFQLLAFESKQGSRILRTTVTR